VEVGADAVVVEDVLDVAETVGVTGVTGEGVEADEDDDCPAAGDEALAPLCGAGVVTVVFGVLAVREASSIVVAAIAFCATLFAVSRSDCGTLGPCARARSINADWRRATSEVRVIWIFTVLLYTPAAQP
jgi:hypothetical protein